MVNTFVFSKEKGQTFSVKTEDVPKYLSPEFRLWIDVEPLGEAERELLSSCFQLHHLALDDCRNEATRPKIESYKDYLFIVFDALNFNPGEEVMDTINLNIFLGENFIVSVHAKPLQTVQALQKKLQNGSPLLSHGVDRIAHGLLDGVVDNYFPIVDELDDRIEEAEEEILKGVSAEVQREIFHMKKRVIALRRFIAPPEGHHKYDSC